MEKYDLLVVGAGAAGMHAARIASKNNLKTLMIETSGDIGGQIAKFYPEKWISNLPFINDIIAKNLVDNMYEKLKNEENLKFFSQTSIVNVLEIDDSEYEKTFNITLTNNQTYNFKRVILCSGAGKLEPMHFSELEYANTIYTVKDFSQFKSKKVVIFGGGNSAVDFANAIVNYTKEVYLVHRREEFRTTQAEVDKMVKNKIQIFADYTVIDKKIENGNLKSILIKNNKNNSEKWIECDNIIIAYGFVAKKYAIPGLENIAQDARQRIYVDEKNMTSNAFVYAAGDCCTYNGKIWNILSSQHEAEKAVLNIEKDIKKAARVIGW